MCWKLTAFDLAFHGCKLLVFLRTNNFQCVIRYYYGVNANNDKVSYSKAQHSDYAVGEA